MMDPNPDYYETQQFAILGIKYYTKYFGRLPDPS